jgi:hypothetical protein
LVIREVLRDPMAAPPVSGGILWASVIIGHVDRPGAPGGPGEDIGARIRNAHRLRL